MMLAARNRPQIVEKSLCVYGVRLLGRAIQLFISLRFIPRLEIKYFKLLVNDRGDRP